MSVKEKVDIAFYFLKTEGLTDLFNLNIGPTAEASVPNPSGEGASLRGEVRVQPLPSSASSQEFT